MRIMTSFLRQCFYKMMGLNPIVKLLSFYPYPKAYIQTSENIRLTVQVANNRLTRSLGLSFRQNIGPLEGLLFCFPDEAIRAFHMQGMKFSLDLVWFNKEGKVLYVSYNILPGRLPFTVPVQVQYVLEIPAMKASVYGLGVGTIAQIQFNPD